MIFGPCPCTRHSPALVCLFFFLSFFLYDVASFFVCLVLIEYVVCSVLIEHVQRFDPRLVAHRGIQHSRNVFIIIKFIAVVSGNFQPGRPLTFGGNFEPGQSLFAGSFEQGSSAFDGKFEPGPWALITIVTCSSAL